MRGVRNYHIFEEYKNILCLYSRFWNLLKGTWRNYFKCIGLLSKKILFTSCFHISYLLHRNNITDFQSKLKCYSTSKVHEGGFWHLSNFRYKKNCFSSEHSPAIILLLISGGNLLKTKVHKYASQSRSLGGGSFLSRCLNVFVF